MPTCRAEQELIPPTKANVRARNRGGGWKRPNQCELVFQFHTGSSVMGPKLHPLSGKWSLNNLFQDEVLVGGRYIINLVYTLPIHKYWAKCKRSKTTQKSVFLQKKHQVNLINFCLAIDKYFLNIRHFQ